jgi:TRAP-type C4-dicarboxylate transport system permease small subunit
MSHPQLNNWQDVKCLLITNPIAAISLAAAAMGAGAWNMWQSFINYIAVESHIQFAIGVVASLFSIVLVGFTIWEKWLQIKKLKRAEQEAEAQLLKGRE